MKGWAFAIAGILLMLFIVQPIESMHMSRDEHRWYDEPDWPEKGVEFHDDFFMNYSREDPRMGFRPGMMPPFIFFSAFQISFFEGDIREDMDLQTEDWNISFKPMDRSIRYMTEIMLNKTGAPGMNKTVLDLDFRPTFSEEGRKIFYNLTMRENLTMDQIAIKWRFDIDRESIKEELDRNAAEWDWRHKPEWSSLDSEKGEEMARMHWERMAHFHNRTGDSYDPVETTQTIVEENLVLEVSMDMGSEMVMVESGGFLEFLDPLFEILGTDSEEVNELIKDHMISILIGIAITTSLLVIILPVIVRRKAAWDPIKELDYRQSRYYRKD